MTLNGLESISAVLLRMRQIQDANDERFLPSAQASQLISSAKFIDQFAELVVELAISIDTKRIDQFLGGFPISTQ